MTCTSPQGADLCPFDWSNFAGCGSWTCKWCWSCNEEYAVKFLVITNPVHSSIFDWLVEREKNCRQILIVCFIKVSSTVLACSVLLVCYWPERCCDFVKCFHCLTNLGWKVFQLVMSSFFLLTYVCSQTLSIFLWRNTWWTMQLDFFSFNLYTRLVVLELFQNCDERYISLPVFRSIT